MDCSGLFGYDPDGIKWYAEMNLYVSAGVFPESTGMWGSDGKGERQIHSDVGRASFSEWQFV